MWLFHCSFGFALRFPPLSIKPTSQRYIKAMQPSCAISADIHSDVSKLQVGGWEGGCYSSPIYPHPTQGDFLQHPLPASHRFHLEAPSSAPSVHRLNNICKAASLPSSPPGEGAAPRWTGERRCHRGGLRGSGGKGGGCRGAAMWRKHKAPVGRLFRD